MRFQATSAGMPARLGPSFLTDPSNLRRSENVVKKLAALALVLGLALALAVPALGATRSVKVGDNYFVKNGGATVSVAKRTKVKWNFAGSNPHNVTVTSGPVKFSSPTRSSGSYSRTVTRAGTYKIVCTIHDGMRMTLKVR
jgi:plastocyanin